MAISEFEWYDGIKPPPGVRVPGPNELLELCSEDKDQSCFPYPPEEPTCWIKYGSSLCWNEVCAQVMAYEGLQGLSSEVRVPGIFCAIKDHPYTCIAMEYIPGKTASQCLKEAKDDTAKELVYKCMSRAFSELCRIPVAPGSRPSAISGGEIRHPVFDDVAPRHYENVQQLEDHINAFLGLTKRKRRVEGLAQEPLVFCQSDPHPKNFIFADSGSITAVDFSEASIVPSSFATYFQIDAELAREGVVPSEDEMNNAHALMDLGGTIIMGSYSFARLGRTIQGGDKETQAIMMSLGSPDEESDESI